MNKNLRQILEEKCVKANDFREAKLLSAYFLKVIDAEWVKDYSQTHVFSDKSKFAASLNIWESVTQAPICSEKLY